MFTAIAWLRTDLRIADNPALSAAARAADRVVAVYVHETAAAVRPPGAAARWWLHESLSLLGKDLAERGIELHVEEGDAVAVLLRFEPTHVFFNRRYAPGERDEDRRVTEALQAENVAVESFGAHVLVEPWDIATKQGKPYSVYTPFFRALKQHPVPHPLPRPDRRPPIAATGFDTTYREPHWATKLRPYWQIGEAAAHQALHRFLEAAIADYPVGRDFPARQATSHLSPHLRHGEISPRQVWHAAIALAHAHPERAGVVDKFLSELSWRDFNYHQLYHRPDITTQPMQGDYARLRWREAPEDLRAWQQGRTGIPIVDAGMREMWETGYMENRVRMLTASFLTKNLLIDWRLGEQWFWDCLVDGDIANNPGNWQWIAGSGMDASPYFRIFNPVTQGERFDSAGDYVRRWVPELAALPDKLLHDPSQASPAELERAGVVLDATYPHPIADLGSSRQRALQAVKDLREE